MCIKVASETLCFPSFMSTALVLAKVSPAEAESRPGKAKGRSLKAEGSDDEMKCCVSVNCPAAGAAIPPT